MMKRIKGFFILGIACCFMAACGAKETTVSTPTAAPTEAAEPTAEPTVEPTPEPTAEPTPEPTAEPTQAVEPTAEPTAEPTSEPTPEPTAEPTAEPTPEPTAEPTPTPEPTPTSTPTPTPEPKDTRKFSEVQVYQGKTVEPEQAAKGDVVLFGAYEQDGNKKNGVEHIAWKVLEKKDNKVLLLSVYVLDAKAFHGTASDIGWKKSDLYTWLQDDFYKTAFSETEQNSVEDTGEGKAFLLSLEEVRKYFSVEKSGLNLQTLSDDRLAAEATGYAESQGVWTVGGNACWWLRTGGEVSGTAVEITEDGNLYLLGTDYNYSYNGVRPAIWLNLN